MIFKKIGCVISLALLLSACASSLSDREIRGDKYAAALYYVSYYESKTSTSEVEKVSDKIKEKAGPQYQSVFFEDTKRLIGSKEKNLPFFKDMLLYVSNATKTGLLNSNQILEINDILYQDLAVKAMLQPSTVPDELRKNILICNVIWFQHMMSNTVAH